MIKFLCLSELAPARTNGRNRLFPASWMKLQGVHHHRAASSRRRDAVGPRGQLSRACCSVSTRFFSQPRCAKAPQGACCGLLDRTDRSQGEWTHYEDSTPQAPDPGRCRWQGCFHHALPLIWGGALQPVAGVACWCGDFGGCWRRPLAMPGSPRAAPSGLTCRELGDVPFCARTVPGNSWPP